MPQLTINTTNAQAKRISVAVGRELSLQTNDEPHLERDATAAEVKQYLIQFLRETVLNVEANKAEAIARAAIPDLTLT